MAIEVINRGTSANDGTGDNIREAFRKVNDNFDQVLTNDTTDYTTATTPLAGTEIALVEQGGTFKKVAVSEFGGGGDDTFTLHFQTLNKTWVLNTWYQQNSNAGFNISGTATYGTGSVPTSTVHLNGSWLLIPSNFIIDEITFGIQATQGTSGQLYSTEVYITRGELAYESIGNTQSNLEIISQEVVSATISVGNPKFYKKLTIASHTPLDLSILQVVMRNTSATTNLTYNVSMAIKFKKA